MNYWVKQLSTLKQKTSAQAHQDKSDTRQEWAKCKQCFRVQKPEGFVVPLKSPNPLQTGAASPSSRCARMPFICVSAAEQWHRGGWGDLISASMMSSYATSLTTVCLCCPEGPTNVTSVTPVTSLLVHTLTFLCDDFWKGKMVTCVLCEGICTR